VTNDSLTQLPIDAFLTRLASKEPTPGGGSVAALTGALASALGQMVAAFTIGKPKFATVEPEVRAIADRLTVADQVLRKLIDEDTAAYSVLSEAFRLEKTDPKRAERIAQAAGLAGGVPLETVAFCAKLLVDLKRLRDIGNPLLRADADAALHLAHAALHAAAANVRANLPLMNAQESEEIRNQLDVLLESETPA